MKEYKLVYLNKGLNFSREKDLEKAENKLNELLEQGWELQQVTSPNDNTGALIGVFFKERKLSKPRRGPPSFPPGRLTCPGAFCVFCHF